MLTMTLLFLWPVEVLAVLYVVVPMSACIGASLAILSREVPVD